MNVSPDALRKETLAMLKEVQTEMDKYTNEAAKFRTSPFLVKDIYGRIGYAELVTAKLSALNTLALLNEQGKK